MRRNKLSLMMSATVSLVILSFIILMNQWVGSQINRVQSSTERQQRSGEKSNLAAVVADGPHLPVIDPNNDPLAPRVKPPSGRPAAEASPAKSSQKVYDFPTDGVLVQ